MKLRNWQEVHWSKLCLLVSQLVLQLKYYFFVISNNWFGILPFWRVAQLLLRHWGCLCQNPWLSARHCELRSPARRSQARHTSSSHPLFDSLDRRTRTRHKRLLRECHRSAETHQTRGTVTALFPLLSCEGQWESDTALHDVISAPCSSTPRTELK